MKGAGSGCHKSVVAQGFPLALDVRFNTSEPTDKRHDRSLSWHSYHSPGSYSHSSNGTVEFIVVGYPVCQEMTLSRHSSVETRTLSSIDNTVFTPLQTPNRKGAIRIAKVATTIDWALPRRRNPVGQFVVDRGCRLHNQKYQTEMGKEAFPTWFH